MNRVMLLMLTVALTACGSSQPSETVDFLAAHPERIKEIQRQCKEDRTKSVMNFAAVLPKPPIGVSSVTDLSRSPNSSVVVASQRQSSR